MSGYSILFILPRNLLSYLIGKLVLIEKPAFLAQFSVRMFVQLTGIDMSEAERPITAYPCIGTLFTRKLKDGVRPIGATPVSPVDGTHRESGPIQQGSIPQVKGKTYSVESFLDGSAYISRFQSGYFCNLYLSPRHYHRVHSPVSGKILGYSYIPGTLWPVNDWSIHTIDQLFCVNERVIVYIDTGSDLGLVAVALVGATNVGKISLAFSPLVTNQSPLRSGETLHTVIEKPVEIAAGDPLGIFHMGSTVVLLSENELHCNFLPQQEVCFGQSLLR